MKKQIKRILAVFLAVLMIPGASLFGYLDLSELFTVEAAASEYLTSGYCGEETATDIAWTLDEDGVLTITGKGRMAPEAFTYDLRIKSVIIGDGIENIGAFAFSQCKNLENITIGKDVAEIEKYAFYYCSSLEKVDLPNAVTIIKDLSFAYCTALKSFTFSDSLTTIEEWAFAHDIVLTDIKLPDSLKTIEKYAFTSCNSIESIELPDSVTTIGERSFAACKKMTSLYIGDGLVSLPDDAFANCDVLSSVVVSEDSTSYASIDNVVYNKEKTTLVFVATAVSGTITIPSTVESFSYTAVDTCENLTDINIEEGSLYYKSIDGVVYTADGKTLIVCPRGKTGSISVADGVETIEEYAFSSCVDITGVILPNTLISINGSAFENCDVLANITFPNSLKYIDSNAFQNCDALESIVLPDSIQRVEFGTFSYCKKLTEVYIGSGLQYLRTTTFDECPLLSSVTVSEDNNNLVSVDNVVYSKSKTSLYFVPENINGAITIPKTVESLSYNSVDNCDNLTDINIEEGSLYYKSVDGIVYSADGKSLIVCPRGKQGSVAVADGTEIVKDYAFKSCSISSITFPNSLISIGVSAFCYCASLVSVILPESLMKIGSNAFSSCYSLKTINIPPNITTLTYLMLYNGGFTELTLPDTVQTYTAGWSSLKTLTIENKYCYHRVSSGYFYLPSNCTIRGYCGSPAHDLAIKRLLNFESLGHTYLDWYTVSAATYEADGIERRDCAYCDGYEERVIPQLQADSYTATFVANGEVVATIDFPKGTTEIDEPAVPAKDRYMGEWEDYTLSDSNITINAVYTLIKSSDASEIEADSTIIHYTGKDDVLFKLTASADATVVKSTISNSVPLDIVLVVDQSGSMEETLGGKTKKVDALKETALEFVNSVYENAKLTDCDHRISLVGFGLSGNYNGYEKNENTELLTSAKGIVNYSNITPADYASSLVNVNVDGSVNDELVTAVDNIGARGATAADLGFEMAKGIFANTDSSGRQRVVVFMTDGEPTYLSGFQTSVANSAIANAYTLKNAYDASIYSVGVFSSSLSNNSNITKFMNAVSSGYPDAMSMTSMGSGNDGEFFTTVNNTDSLSSVFKSISTESLSHTAPFDNITFIKTLSKYVTLTSQQEQTLRIDLIRQYGITNDDIIITRNSDGTTTIEIRGLTPEKTVDEDENVKYVVSVEFFASLNENAAASDEYFVDTEDSGVILSPDAKGYEVTFNTSAVTVSEAKTRVIFTVNGEVYEISEDVDSNGYIVAPEIEISDDWTFVSWDTSSQKATNGLVLDATLTKAERTVIWHTDSGDIVQTYIEGDFITAHTVEYNKEGYAFLSWDRSIPTTMPDENLEFTAVYGQHEHNYVSSVTTAVTCETDGVRTYVCNCGDTYTETITALGHNYEAITPSIEKDDSKCTFVCSNCGDKYDYALDYQVVSASGKRTQVLYEFQLTDDNLDYGFQPDGEIQIRIPLSEIHANAKDVKVIRTNDDGTKTQVPAVIENGFLVITCDHFTPYEVNFDIECDEHSDLDGDGLCDECEFDLETESETVCNHMCHSENAFCGFFWKIISFIYKLFGMTDKQICECGISHW